jgi:hypothetical protein
MGEQEMSEPTVEATRAVRPTRSAFMAAWHPVAGARGYRLDVSTDPAFASLVEGYRSLDVGSSTSEVIRGLHRGTHYYYRVQSYDSLGRPGTFETSEAETADGVGLVIDPFFDASITSSGQASLIEGTIMETIAVYETMFSDPINVEILYRYSTTQPDGSAIPSSAVSTSLSLTYQVNWSDYIAFWKQDVKTSNDKVANSSLPPTALANLVLCHSAAGRAIALNTPALPYTDPTVGDGRPLDGIITLNLAQTIQFFRPPSPSYFDAFSAIEHETDEVLGLGSHLNDDPVDYNELSPQDLFSWSGPHTRNTSTTGPRYFAIDLGITKVVDFNQESDGDYGDWASPSCPQPHPRVQNAFGCRGSAPSISVSSPEGVNLDVIGYDLVPATADPPRLANISTRAKVETGDSVLIGGFIISGSSPKQVLLRALGPSLTLAGPLANPSMQLYSGSTLVASNDNWRSTQEAEIIATGIPPTKDLESAIVATLDPGAYTAIVKGVAGGSGIALVEVYDLDQTADSTLANISTRGVVGTGLNVLIGGFIVQDGISATVVVRALGPSLPLSGALADPTLELHDAFGALVVSNDNWKDEQEPGLVKIALAPTNDSESAIISTLPPGPYTAIVQGKNGTSGVGLVEVYQLPN